MRILVNRGISWVNANGVLGPSASAVSPALVLSVELDAEQFVEQTPHELPASIKREPLPLPARHWLKGRTEQTASDTGPRDSISKPRRFHAASCEL